MEALEAAAAEATSDSARPAFHFRPPACLMSDPNGPIHHRDWYHLFYQIHPFGTDFSDPELHWYWGHARSHDLVRWEHLPVALWPSTEKGEQHCASGCTLIDGQGRPVILYTSMGPGSSYVDAAQQWAAYGDDDLILWQKSKSNPAVPESVHGELKVTQWRDPCVVRHEDHAWLVLGGKMPPEAGGDAVVLLYEGSERRAEPWRYRGVLFRHPDKNEASVELPQFFRMGEKWGLIYSVYRRVDWRLGAFDTRAGLFMEKSSGQVDADGDRFYAAVAFPDGRGRTLLLGCISRGKPRGRGWHGCLALPRVLSVGIRGELLQDPIPELDGLRGRHLEVQGVALGIHQATGLASPGMEIRAQMDLGSARACGLRLHPRGRAGDPVEIRYDGQWVTVGGGRAPLQRVAEEGHLTLRVFVDRSVVEVFANRRACVTQVVEPTPPSYVAEAFAEGGNALLVQMDIWELASVW